MKTSLSTTLLVLFCTVLTWSQGWERIYEKANSQFPVAAGYTASGKIQISGSNGFTPGSNVNGGFYHLVADLNGDSLFTHNTVVGDKSLLHAIFTQDGGTIITGHDNSVNTAGVYWEKLDSMGNQEWIYTTSTRETANTQVCETADGDYYFISARSTWGTGDVVLDPMLRKVDVDGNILFTEVYPGLVTPDQGGLNATSSTATSDGGVLFAYNKLEGVNDTTLLIKVNELGVEEWRQEYDVTFTYELLEADNGDFFLVGTRWTAGPTDDLIVQRIDSQGNTVWRKQDAGIAGYEARSISKTQDGNYYITGSLQPAANANYYIFLAKMNPQGDFLWFQGYPNRGKASFPTDVFTAADGGAYIAGTHVDVLNDRDYYLIKTDTNGVSLTNEVLGTVFYDEIEDCLPDASESGLENWIVQLEGNNLDFYANTNDFGSYALPAQEGNYTLRTFPPSPYWEPCQAEYPVNFANNNYDVQNIDIPIQANVDCPYMEVSNGTWALRPCFASRYTVDYCNYGTVDAEGVYVEVTLDSFLMVDSASIPFTELNGVYTFELDSVALGECGSFYINVFLDCNTPLGITHCVEAHIYPDSLCMPTSNWSGASVEVDAACVDGDIVFSIQNVGTAAITAPVEYFVVEDDVILMQGTINELAASEIEVLPLIPGQGGTFRLEANQEPNHPGLNSPSVAVEGCTTTPPFTTGFINIFPQNDADPYIDIDCIVNTASYDPNDKQGLPLGWGEDHIIEKNQDLEYRLRFQNVGTDTAFNIVILDTLSALLDINTIRPGAASHPYEFRLTGEGVLEFKFKDILLPDSTTNELASNGFVKYRIKQKKDLPLGSVINNSAAIYFDFNDPVITNTTVHTIGELDRTVGTEDLGNALEAGLELQPNPFSTETVFDLAEYPVGTGVELRVYDAIGRLERVEQVMEQQFVFRREALANGIYFYQLEQDGTILTSGKMVIN